MSDSQPHGDPSDTTPTDRPDTRRASVVDRRMGVDRRDLKSDKTGLERRRGPGRRRSDNARQAEEGEMTPEQFLFIKAIEAYKRVNKKTFPTWSEVLEVIRKLGYRKTVASQLNLKAAEDWTEPPDAPVAPPKEEALPGHEEEPADLLSA